MNIRLPQPHLNQGEEQEPSALNQQPPLVPPPNLGPGAAHAGQGGLEQGSAWGHPALAPLGRPPDQHPQQPPRKDQVGICTGLPVLSSLLFTLGGS